MSKFKDISTKYLNARAKIRDDARAAFVTVVANSPKWYIIGREPGFFEDLAEELTGQLFDIWLPRSLAAAQKYTTDIGALGDMVLTDGPGVTNERAALATESIEFAASSAGTEFELTMAKLDTAQKPIEFMQQDLEASRPELVEKKTGGRTGRAVEVLRYGGKYYAKAFKKIWTAVEEELESITSAMAVEYQGRLE